MFAIQQLQEEDFEYISPRIDEWWGGRNMFTMLPRLWFKDFAPTSLVAKNEEGQIVGFLAGFISPAYAEKAYVHFIGVDPTVQKQGIGKQLYLKFAQDVSQQGCKRIEAVTHPINKRSLAFHEAMGFVSILPGGGIEPPTQSTGLADYDGHGEDRVILRWNLDTFLQAEQ